MREAEPGGRTYLALTCRVLYVAVASVAIISGLFYHPVDGATFDIANYFSFFTVQSNLLGLAWMTATVFVMVRCMGSKDRVAGRLEDGSVWSVARGGIVLYLLVTAIVYQSVLRGGAGGSFFAQARDWTMHGVLPAAFLLDWLIDRGKNVLPWRSMLYWLTFPFLFCSYSLVRGHITGWYPYYFLDPVHQGSYAMVALGCAVILVLMLALGSSLVLIDRACRRRSSKTGKSG